MFEIEKDKPIPPRRKYPFEDMEVGDSFFAPRDDFPHAGDAARVYAHHRKGKVKFRTRNVTENGVNGTRVWRIE